MRVERNVEIYRGRYYVRNIKHDQYQHWNGIIEKKGSKFQVFVLNPPAEISSHPKSPCFAPMGSGKFKVRWVVSPRDVDDGIYYVERVLSEVINGR